MSRKPLSIDRYVKRKGASPNFYFIRRVPTDITKLTGKQWENRSLDTGDLQKARVYAQSLNNELESEWASLRLKIHHRPGNIETWEESLAFLAAAEADELNRKSDAEIMNRFVELEQIDLTQTVLNLTDAMLDIVQPEDAVALASKYRIALLKEIIRLGKNKRVEEIQAVETQEDFKRTFSKSKLVEIGAPSLSKVLNEYCLTKEQGEDEDRLRLSVNSFISFAGDKSINHYKRKDVLDFLERLENYPVKLKAEYQAATFVQITSGRHLKTLTKRTAKEWFNRIQKVFEFGIHKYGDDFNIQNPWKGLTSYIKGRASIKKQPFTAQQLKVIFTHPDFISNEQRNWVASLCLYHGARMDEFLCRQYQDFYDDEDGIFVVKISDAKNDQSNRIIPIHDTVLKRGFRRWLERRNKDGWVRPFSEYKQLPPDDHRFSKNFGRFLSGLPGITEETTFHSFRHNFASVAEAKLLSETVVAKIQGHKVGHIHGDIYVKLKPKEMKATLDQITYDDIDCLLGGSTVTA